MCLLYLSEGSGLRPGVGSGLRNIAILHGHMRLHLPLELLLLLQLLLRRLLLLLLLLLSLLLMLLILLLLLLLLLRNQSWAPSGDHLVQLQGNGSAACLALVGTTVSLTIRVCSASSSLFSFFRMNTSRLEKIF